MEIKVNRVFWDEQKNGEDRMLEKYIYIDDILSIESSFRDSQYTEIYLTFSPQMPITVNEEIEVFKKRFEALKLKLTNERREEEKRDDLGL